MKEQLINNIICMLQEQGIQIDGLHEKLILLFRNVECTPIETSLAVIDETANEHLIKQFVAAKMISGCTKRTISFYAKILMFVTRKINKNIPEITADDVRVYSAGRLVRDKVTKVTVDNEIRVLRSFYAYLCANEIVQKNIMLQIDKMKPDKVKKHSFSEMEVEQIRSACRNARESAIIELLLSTGCRVSELCQIQIADIQQDKILVHGKGNKDRTVYLNAKAQLAISKYLSQRSDNNPWLFAKGYGIGGKCKPNALWWQNPAEVADGHASQSNIEMVVRKLGGKIGVQAYPHKFRRTCATMALRRGMQIEQVSKMLGHEQITTTQIYLDLQEEDLEIAHRKYVT